MADKLVVVLGETASGKSALALELAKRFDGEIICADSRTVYRGMDIGTAKPSDMDQKQVTHHLLDILAPDETFNVGEFKRLATQTIDDVLSRGRLPILVGGTGLYIDAVLFDYQFSPPGARRKLQNLRHLKYQEHKAYKNNLRPNTLVVGLDLSKGKRKDRITKRIADMFARGLLEEVKSLAQTYGWSAPGLNTIGYREFESYFMGEQTLEETAALVERNTILYAKRQRTWFRRNNSIHWLDDPRDAVDLVTTFLNKKQ